MNKIFFFSVNDHGVERNLQLEGDQTVITDKGNQSLTQVKAPLLLWFAEWEYSNTKPFWSTCQLVPLLSAPIRCDQRKSRLRIGLGVPSKIRHHVCHTANPPITSSICWLSSCLGFISISYWLSNAHQGDWNWHIIIWERHVRTGTRQRFAIEQPNLWHDHRRTGIWLMRLSFWHDIITWVKQTAVSNRSHRYSLSDEAAHAKSGDDLSDEWWLDEQGGGVHATEMVYPMPEYGRGDTADWTWSS